MKTTIDDLITAVIDQISEDINDGYTEAVEELLKFCPNKNLIHYLPEDVWEDYKHLLKED